MSTENFHACSRAPNAEPGLHANSMPLQFSVSSCLIKQRPSCQVGTNCNVLLVLALLHLADAWTSMNERPQSARPATKNIRTMLACVRWHHDSCSTALHTLPLHGHLMGIR